VGSSRSAYSIRSFGYTGVKPTRLIDWLAVTRTLYSLFLVSIALGAQQPGGEAARPAPRGSVEGRLTWFDRQGKKVGTIGDPGVYRTLSISPDGKRVAVERTDPQTQNRDIWVLDSAGGAGSRFTSDPAWEAFPLWSPDGSRIIFTSNRTGVYDLYQKPSSNTGTEELLYKSSEGKGPTSWSPDGKFWIYYSLGQPTHLRLLAASGPADRMATPIVDSQFNSITGRFSPDGKWIVYTSNESGMNEVSVRPFDAATGTAGKPVTVTSGGGRTPVWSGDGKEIFYITSDGTVMALEVKAGTAFQAGTAKPLFKVPSAVLFWDVAPNTSGDGVRFLMPVPGT
jgi:Tol biopolymer transport system component